MRRYCFFLLPLFCLVFLMGCKLTIATFNAPDTANTGSVIPLTISCTATNMSDGSSVNGVVVQIPAGWSVLYAKVTAGGNSADLTEDAGIAGLYTAEPGNVIWAGTINSQNSGSEGSNVSFTIKVLTGNFSGSYGQTQDYNLKAVVGAKRGGVWVTDDPENAFNFAAVTGEKYEKSITVTKVDDITAPDPITNPVAVINNGTQIIQVSWNGYDEAAQGDVVTYRVYRSTNDFFDVSSMTPIAVVSAGRYDYGDHNFIPGNGYYYGVTAVDELGHEDPLVSAVYIFVYVPGSIGGTLFDSNSMTPITGKNIWISAYIGSPCGNSTQVGQANVNTSTGNYSITGLQPGTYYLHTYTNENYISEWWASPQSVRDCAGAQSIVVTEGQAVSGKNFQLDPGTTISGSVYKSDGVTPLTGKNIWIVAYIGSPCGNRTQVSQANVNTSTGNYSITGLQPGTYYLHTYTNENYISEWWASPQSVRDCAGAQSIVVTEGQAVSGKNFQLDPAATIGLTGPGWNLISLPQQPSDTAIGNVLSSISGKYSSAWAFQNGSWKVFDPASPGFSDLSTLEAGWGYWLNMTEATTLSVTGTEPSKTMNLIAGWNLVGYNSSTSLNVTDALTSIAGKVISVWAYKNNSWQFYDPASPGFSDLTTMSPGYGYWINTNGACTWTLP